MSRQIAPQWLAHLVVVSPTFQELDAAVLQRLAEKNPKATPEQLPDEVYARGLLHLAEEMNITLERG